jgi:DNA-binding response OmpR family regulator
MKKRILVVEDDPQTAALLAKLLSMDYEVVQVSDGAEALWELQQDPPPDLFVADVMLPEMDGLSVIREMKQNPRTRGIPVIIITAKDSPKDVIEGINTGAKHYITKPFKGAEVLDKVKRAIGV